MVESTIMSMEYHANVMWCILGLIIIIEELCWILSMRLYKDTIKRDD